MKDNHIKFLVLAFLIVSFMIHLLALSTYGWLQLLTPQPVTIDASIITQYFDHGSGTQEDPFVITRPIHYYHLVALYQLKYGIFATEGLYYQLGYDMDNNGTPEVYEYDNNGMPTGNTSSSLNMTCYPTLWPIGTSQMPFCDDFNGNGLTVSNLTVTQEGICDLGIFGCVTENALIHDVYFDNIILQINDMAAYSSDLDSQTDAEHIAHADDKAYVGYIVGHLQSHESIQNTYINHCQIVGEVDFTTLNNTYGYFGYCERAGSLEEFVAHATPGGDATWGGSINMSEMYTRLYNLEGRATTQNNYVYDRHIVYNPDGTVKSNTATLSTTAYTLTDANSGSFVFTTARGQYLYLHGGTTITEDHLEYTGNTITGYYIHNGNNYLSIVNGDVANTNQTSATLWKLTGNFSSSKLYATIDGTTYYLTSSLNLSTNANNGQTWTFATSGNAYTLSYSSTGFFARTYYIRYNNGTWSTNRNNSTALTFTESSVEETRVASTRTYVDYTGTNNTYFPLVVGDNGAPTNKNTGYVVAGSNDRTTSGTYPSKAGDIRVSRYTTSNISNSYSGGSLTRVYTFNLNNTQQTVDPSDFMKYTDSVNVFLSSITDGNVYGLHFMSGEISEDNIVTAARAVIEENTYTNYQLPANSIDFLVSKNGYINFFAGTYFSGNNSFFSLHQIFRDENNAISAIKEISEIYSNGNLFDDYIYKYDDGTYSDTLTNEHSLVFSTTQIKRHNSLTTNAVYYFEIPVNAGEYALGSVNGGTGAYLMYLDIAANGNADDAGVTDFGSVEYRSTPDTADKTTLLFSFIAPQGAQISVSTRFENNTYYVTATGESSYILYVALLTEDYSLYVNGTRYSGIRLNRITIP